METQQQAVAERISEDVSRAHWRDWKWQLKHSITDLKTFEEALGVRLSDADREAVAKTAERFPISITPYYLSLIDTEDYATDPVYKQAFPSAGELIRHTSEHADPLAEDKDSPVEGLTHRYPDRVLMHVSNVCSMYCRHCTRKRKVGDTDCVPNRDKVTAMIDYVRRTPQVRDVLLSGGDPFMLSDEYIEWIVSELHKIDHVEIIRIGTRMPVVLPYRITDELVDRLKKYQPIWINTHFNHPREITESSREALRKLADAGFVLGNQSVLLADINDCPRIMRALCQKLVANRVRPYYLYQCDLSEGLAHFRTPVSKGIEIMESMIGHTSGLAVPTYVVDAPGGGGKIRVNPTYLISWSPHKVVLRNYEGVITTYEEPDTYEQITCDGECEKCRLTLKVDEASEYKALGIERLLSHYDDTTSLVPEDNARHERRDEPGTETMDLS